MKKIIVVIALALAACQGRDPNIGGEPDPIVEPPPPPPPEGRSLERRRLFGDMPVENRVLDPLMTLTGTGWFAFANDFQREATVFRRVEASPTRTPLLMIPVAGNPVGATVIGQLKTATTPLHVEVWIGRDPGVDPATASVSLLGLFTSGSEEAVPLAPDVTTSTTIGSRTWMRYSADLDAGPIGWSYLIAGDEERGNNLYLTGAVAVDLPARATGALVPSLKRPATARERLLVDVVRERTRQLAAPAEARPKHPLLDVPQPM